MAISGFQAMLDRGEQLDWFESTEVRIVALIAAVSFAYFVVHTMLMFVATLAVMPLLFIIRLQGQQRRVDLAHAVPE